MGIFAALAGRGAQAGPVPGAEPGWDVLPARFEAVGDHLAAGQDASAASAMVGRETARDGADLGEALDGLRTIYALVQGGQPDYRAVRALCVAWSEETLGYLHQLSCEDPLTGLASLAHLRARLSEVYRAAEQQGEASVTTSSHVLVVTDLPLRARSREWPSTREDAFTPILQMVRLAESARRAFPGGETICQARSGRLVVLADRGEGLALRVRMLRDLVEDAAPETGRPRVWIEGLPTTNAAAGLLLDELARG